jgi:hypothetical protein
MLWNQEEQQEESRNVNSTASINDLNPVYAQDTAVQYFSSTHKCWLNAWAHLTVYRDEFGIRHVCYNIQVARQSTVRNDVPLDMLRLPLVLEEKVEVFIKRGDGGFWVPGTVSGQKSNGKTSPDYRIQLLEKTLDRVPAIRIRRYFAPGDAVEVYRGSSRGWVPATVQERRDTAGYPAPISKSSPQPPSHPPTNATNAVLSSRDLARQKSGATRSRSTPLSRARSRADPPPEEEGHVSEVSHPWVNVLIAEESEFDSPEMEEVPLWLLRQPVAAKEDPEDNEGAASRFFSRLTRVPTALPDDLFEGKSRDVGSSFFPMCTPVK